IGLEDALADAGERFTTPVRESCDQPVNAFRWIHWTFMPRILFPRTSESGHSPSGEVLPAVRRQRRAGDEAGIVGREADAAARDGRKTTQRAVASGSPSRPSGMCGRRLFSSTSWGTALTISVAI